MNSSYEHLDERQTIELFESQMADNDKGPYANYGHKWIDTAYAGRKFVIYRAGRLRNEAEVIASVDVQAVWLSPEGLRVSLVLDKTGEEITLDHVPRKLFRYAVFAWTPSHCVTRTQVTRYADGDLGVSSASGVVFKTRNKPEFHNQGNIYLQPLSSFRIRFPNTKIA